MAAHYFNTVENKVTGKPVNNADVSVLTAPSASGGTEVTIYSDEALSVTIDNPIPTDENGFFEFYTAFDSVCLEIAYDGATQRIIDNVNMVGGEVSGDVTSLQTRMDAAEVITQDATIVAFKGLTGTANTVPYFTGTDTMALADFTAAGRALLDDASAAAQATTLGLGTGDSPQFTAINLGHASDTTLARSSAGQVTIEGNAIYHVGNKPTESLVIACSDETTALTTGTGKVTFRMPYAFTLSAVRASLTTAQTSGSIFTVDINEAGTTILSTKLTIDNTEKTSTTAATAAVISDSSLADDAEITIDIDQIGDGTAKGLKVVLIGTRT